MILKLWPDDGLKPFTNVTFSVPSRVTAPLFETFPVIAGGVTGLTPFKVPPCRFICGLGNTMLPPLIVVVPAVCVYVPELKNRDPLAASTVPALVNARLLIVLVPVPPDFLNVPPLLKA